MNRIVVIGGGNVAASLVPALGDRVVQVYSRTHAHAEELAPGRATDCLDSVTADADVYIITLVDDAVAPTAQRLARLNPGALWVHTSGSVPIEALDPLGPRRGVVYPLQTFSRGRRRDFADIPLFIEGDDPVVGQLARSLSRRVLEADSARRRRLHVAAVFGCNFVNPALVGRAMLLASYASAMTHWVGFGSKLPLVGSTADVVTSSTPMAVMKGIFSAETAEDALAAVNDLTSTFSISDMFIGRIGGSLGETSALALLLGFVYLLLRRVINWQIPVCYIGTVAVLTLISAPAGMSAVDFMLYNVFGGGLMLGAIFMATDYATSPVTKLGQAIFGVGCGLITCFIRRFGSYPEGVCYSILIMNCTTWLLDKYIRPTIYGAIKKDKKEAAAK